jgi:hypothetical protein
MQFFYNQNGNSPTFLHWSQAQATDTVLPIKTSHPWSQAEPGNQTHPRRGRARASWWVTCMVGAATHGRVPSLVLCLWLDADACCSSCSHEWLAGHWPVTVRDGLPFHFSFVPHSNTQQSQCSKLLCLCKRFCYRFIPLTV